MKPKRLERIYRIAAAMLSSGWLHRQGDKPPRPDARPALPLKHGVTFGGSVDHVPVLVGPVAVPVLAANCQPVKDARRSKVCSLDSC